MAAFPPLDYSRFSWRPAPDDANLIIREAGGGEVIEDVWNKIKNGEQTLFIGAKATLARPVPEGELLAAARTAWAATRFTIPTIALSTTNDAAGNTLMTYRIARTAADAAAWAERTVRLGTAPDLDELRFELGKLLLPEANGDQTFLYILRQSDTKYDLLIHTSHVPFDGAAVKIALSRFLQNLTRAIADPAAAAAPLAWGEEHKNLVPVVTEVMAPSEPREGPLFDQTLGGILGDLGASMPRQYGFKPRKFDNGPTRRVWHTFSADETKKLLQASSARGFTINHVAHAALCLVCALDNPPTPETAPDAAFVFYGLADCRSRLAPPYNTIEGYPGYALGMSAIIVPVADAVEQGAEGKAAVITRLSQRVKEEYAKQKAYPALIAACVHEIELMMLQLKSAGGPPPPWMGPWYAGDGIGETYLYPEYKDGAGATLLKVDDFFVSLNKTDPGPFFRAFSWGGRLTLSADANVNAMPVETVQGWVDQWADLLRATI